MNDIELSYVTSEKTKRRLLHVVITFIGITLFVLVGGFAVYTVDVVNGAPTPHISEAGQIAANCFFMTVFSVFGTLATRKADPQRLLEWDRQKTFSRLSILGICLCPMALVLAVLQRPIRNFCVKQAVLYTQISALTVQRSVVVLVLLVCIAAFCISAMDLILAFFRKVPMKGYFLSTLTLTMGVLYLPLFSMAERQFKTESQYALFDRHRRVEIAGTLASDVVFYANSKGRYPSSLYELLVALQPQKLKDFPMLPPAPSTRSDWLEIAGEFHYLADNLATSTPFDRTATMLFVQTIEVPDGQGLDYEPSTTSLTYAYEGYLAGFADGHVEVIYPTFWQRKWQSHNDARKKAGLPAQSDPFGR